MTNYNEQEHKYSYYLNAVVSATQMYQDRTKGTKSNMNDNEPKMELCSNAWIYDHTEYDTVYLRCPYCNMVRMAMPGEPCQMVCNPIKPAGSEE